MAALTDFDNRNHRIESATAAFQKGLYHLFVLKKRTEGDVYAQVIRIYQCLFQICLSQLLLDSNFTLNTAVQRLARRLRQRCQNPQQPARKDLDPACLVTHSVFENRSWNGFPMSHPLGSVTKFALALYAHVVDARHNLLYRPFLLDGLLWEDCALIDLIGETPSANDVESVYREFISAIWDWQAIEQDSRVSKYFIQTLFVPYKDKRRNRPTETLLITYARMLNPGDHQLPAELRDYRNELLDVGNDSRYNGITLLPEWRFGEA
jgi:hypothetical protein